MKVTKSGDRVEYLEQEKSRANLRCNICPSCGEIHDIVYYLHKGIMNKGIMDGLCKTWAKGFFKMKSMKSDCYICHTCGCEWESEPYEY